MKRGAFAFRFERLARIRSIRERVARAAWSEAEVAAREAQRELEALRHEIAEARTRTVADQRADRISPREVLAVDRAHVSLLRALTRLRGRELSLRGTAEACRRTWTARDREVESLARLRQREAGRHRLEQEQLAARELDEIALGRTRAAGREAEHGSSRPAGAADTTRSEPDRPVAGSPAGPLPGAPR